MDNDHEHGARRNQSQPDNEATAKAKRTRIRAYAPGTTCAKAGCPHLAKARGLCNGHYMRARRGVDSDAPIDVPVVKDCSFPHCARAVHAGALCAGHYGQRREGKELAPLRDWTKKEPALCAATDCTRPNAHAGLCDRHYQRKREGDPSWDRPIKNKARDGEGHLNVHGYRLIRVAGRNQLEHRAVVEGLLGRPLRQNETVHHINGVRDDNRTDGPLRLHNGRLRSGNLELWSSAQPKGQAIGDKLRFCFELIGLYGAAEQRALAAKWLAESSDDLRESGQVDDDHLE